MPAILKSIVWPILKGFLTRKLIKEFLILALEAEAKAWKKRAEKTPDEDDDVRADYAVRAAEAVREYYGVLD